MKTGISEKVDGLGDQVRPLKFRAIQMSRLVIGALFGLAAIVSIWAFLNAVNARKLETMGEAEFADITSTIKVSGQSVEELEALAQKALSIYPPQIELAEQANLELARRLTPCLPCENRTVFIDQYKNGVLTPRGGEALSRSYQLSPYGDEALMKWRLEISARHWDDLDDEQRKAALRQVTALASNPEHRAWLTTELQTDIPELIARIDRLRTPAGTAP